MVKWWLKNKINKVTGKLRDGHIKRTVILGLTLVLINAPFAKAWMGWSIQIVDDIAGCCETSLAPDSADNPIISYYDRTNGYLKYAKYSSDTEIPKFSDISLISAIGIMFLMKQKKKVGKNPGKMIEKIEDYPAIFCFTCAQTN